MTAPLLVRRELATDVLAIRQVHDAAFSSGPATPTWEARLVDRLRGGPDWIPALSLVAEQAGSVVGHVVASRAMLHRDGLDTGLSVAGLAPLGVDPDHQHAGIGSALVYALVGAAEALDLHAVCLLGSPEYYGRFGFVAAAHHGIRPPDASWGEHFQVLVLSAARRDGTTLRGEFAYAAAFDDA